VRDLHHSNILRMIKITNTHYSPGVVETGGLTLLMQPNNQLRILARDFLAALLPSYSCHQIALAGRRGWFTGNQFWFQNSTRYSGLIFLGTFVSV
jgi:hypothetical protein